MGGLAALALLTHCGGGETEERPPMEVGPESPTLLRQEVSTAVTFGAIADARVEQENPTLNFGGDSKLVADTSPLAESYLRFNVSEVTGTVTRAVLRLYASDGTTDGPRLHLSGREWTEGGLTWNNRPGPNGIPLEDKGAITSGTWVEYDVSRVVRGNGQVDFVLVGTSGNGTDFASREHGSADLRPQLVLTVEPGLDCMQRTETRNIDILATYDGYASQSQPTRRSGSEPVLLVDSAPDRLETFLQFRVNLYLSSGWHVRQTKLRLHATDYTSDGPLLYRASNDWPALDFDWNTRPALTGGPLGNLGIIEAGTWVEYDVSSIVTGDGIYSFGLLPESTNGVDFVSANTTTGLQPRLLLTVESDPYCSYRGTGGGLTGWTRQYGGTGTERLHALATDAQGNFVTAGHFGDDPFHTETGFALARYTADGTPVWTRHVTTDDVWVMALTVTPLGNILVVGHYTGSPDLGTGPLPTATAQALFIAKFSPTGQTEWARGFSATYVRPPEGELEHWPVIPRSVATDANGSLIVVGGFRGQMDLGGGPLFAGATSVDRTRPSMGGFVAKFSWEGHHLWSKAFEAGQYAMPEWVWVMTTVATDPAGNVLVGGHVSSNADLGDGQSGTSAPFIAKYDASGTFVWKRLFVGAYGEDVDVQPLGTSGVAFSANLGQSFTFGGITYTGGNPEAPGGPNNVSGFTGTLSATGTDGWIRDLGRVSLSGLVTGGSGTLTVTGSGSDYDLGGGHVSAPSSVGTTPFVVRYSASDGRHLWSRSFDRDFRSPLHLAPQPGGSVVVGGYFTSSIQQDGRTYTTRGDSDLLYFQLKP